MADRGIYLPEADLARQLYIKEDPMLATVGHFHEGIELVAMVKGKVEAYHVTSKSVLTEGEIFFADSFESHYYKPLTPDMLAIVIVLSREYTSVFREIYGEKTFPCFMKDRQKNEEIIACMRTWLQDEEKNFLRNVGYCNLLLSKIAEQYPLTKRGEKKDKNISTKLLQYVNDHYMEDISLTSAAKVIGYTKEYCSKIFVETVGLGFRDYLNLLRLRKADEYFAMQKQNKMTATEIAYKCGFNSTATFYRAKKQFEEKNIKF
jgi:AraC-like DNA-binding protein